MANWSMGYGWEGPPDNDSSKLNEKEIKRHNGSGVMKSKRRLESPDFWWNESMLKS